ncbi:putative phosphomethylpyrimidine kinase 2 [Wickerhamomyces ciferrii]|uniref:Phosphomethylpyrimidine kinase 2 n=1 Tax=Wickerhamomyces ciferrii (strain ATCC 14091 / BCRC 22168 / CBS 111 / JCM 3599 / NBRC 0793 / NRRL Y-1031 F-60-10) TaxID=1206466 RepID=K0KW82_WICCF|nr:putative phosphomethylpyrimidine kinase 2 [Wickerhamomyces ciferrii]CCH45403.1 putative phosphomethylpyrimidine kinase 2 [Wickerhamomyces ciferrii]
MTEQSTTIPITWPELSPSKLSTVLTVAGSDSSGGAGIEADVKAITANGAYALTAITALTAQNTKGVDAVQYTTKDQFEKILNANFSDIDIGVIKTGLLTVDAIDVLADYVTKYHVGKPFVIDPVLVATTGATLSKKDVLLRAIDKLIKKATLLTPNYLEAKEILKYLNKDFDIETLEDLQKAAKIIQTETGVVSVLLKGGHIPWDSNNKVASSGNEKFITDVLYHSIDNTFTIYKSDFITTENTHGTGCTLASSISANLAKGYDVKHSIDQAIRYVHGGIVAAEKIGHGNGPLNHVYHIVSPPALTNNLNTLYTEGHFVDFLKNHPTVKPIWELYVNHPFVAQVSSGTLPKHQFVHYLKQDHAYLTTYARVNALAAAVAPDIDCIRMQAGVLENIAHEMTLHVGKLAKHGVYDLKSLELSRAGKEYADHLLNIAHQGDWLEILVSLSPCLFGYGEAANAADLKITEGEYFDWVQDYRAKDFNDAMELGRQSLEKHSIGISTEKALKLVKIFADVSLLEVYFWNDALSVEEEK